MNTNEHTVRVLTMVPVYHLPKELEGPFQSGQVRRGPERRVFERDRITKEYMAAVMEAFQRGAGPFRAPWY